MAMRTIALTCLVQIAFAQSNPIVIKSAVFEGFRNSSNTQTVRDLGFMGNIGNTYILSFGDGVGVLNRTTYNESAPAGGPTGECAYITARNGGAVAGSDPLNYTDVNVITNVGVCGNVPQMGYFCPLLSTEQDGQGLGITNVMQVNSTTGCIWVRPTISPTNATSAGAGLAVVTLDGSGNPSCSRPFGKSTWTNSEPDWGQLSALDGRDGYTYVFANGYNGNISSENNNVVLARAPTSDVFDLNSYQYWHGPITGFTSERIYIGNLSSSSPENVVGLTSVGQGTAFWSTYYSQFVYLSAGPNFYTDGYIYAWTAFSPQGPWSSPVIVWQDNYPQVTTGPTGLNYGGYIMPKYTSGSGDTVYFSFTRGNYEFVIKLVFARIKKLPLRDLFKLS